MDEAVKDEVFRERFPAGLCDVAANETWLEDQARAGYRLTGIHKGQAEFVEAAPCECRFRMEPLAGKGEALDAEREAVYRDLGWTHAGVLDGLFRIWRSDEPAAPELHTDPVVEGEGYRYLKRRMLRRSVGLLLFDAALLALVLWMLLGSGTPLLDILNAAPGRLALCLLWVPLGMALEVLEIRNLRRLWRRLSAGVPLARPRSYRRQRRLTSAVTVLFGLLLALQLLQSGSAIDGSSLSGGWNARDKYTGLPKSGVVYLDVGALDEGTGEPDYFSVRTKVHELAPRTYYVAQYLPLAGEDWAWAKSTYVRLLTPGLARELVWELAAEHRPQGTLTAVETTVLDGLWWSRLDEGEQYAVALRGREVLMVRYRGPSDLRQAEAALAAVLDGV